MSIDQRLRNGLHPPRSEPGPDTLAALRRVEQRAARRARTTRVAVGALVAATLVVVIGVSATLQQQVRPVRDDVAATRSAEQRLLGTYVVDVPDSEAGRREGMVGRWVISLEAGGAVELRPPPGYTGATTGAAWRADDERVRTDALVEPSCQADSGYVGTYAWSITDEVLTFTLVEDQCAARRLLFTEEGWARMP